MLNVFDVAQALIDYVEKEYSDEIAIIAYYGSYAQGTATKRSDLDFFLSLLVHRVTRRVSSSSLTA